MQDELGVSFPVQLENPHIIKDSQVFVGVVPFGPDGTPLNSSFQNRLVFVVISRLIFSDINIILNKSIRIDTDHINLTILKVI